MKIREILSIKNWPDNELATLKLPPPPTVEQSFRFKTVEDIMYLEKEGRKDLAALEAKKLITHLQKEFELC